MDSVRAPETWDTKNVWALKKLYHGGRNDTPDAPYTAYYFRYAELYLMEAELKARLDDYSVFRSRCFGSAEWNAFQANQSGIACFVGFF